MSSPQQVRYLRPGQMPKASEWNSLVQKAKSFQPSKAGFDWQNGTSYKNRVIPCRESVLFYTRDNISIYSAFRFYRTNETRFGRPVFRVEDSSCKSADLIQDSIGVAGPEDVGAGDYFYGYLLNEYYPVIVNLKTENPDYWTFGVNEDGVKVGGPDGIILGKFQEEYFYCIKAKNNGNYYIADVTATANIRTSTSMTYGKGTAKIYFGVSDSGGVPTTNPRYEIDDVVVYNPFPYAIDGYAVVSPDTYGNWFVISYERPQQCVLCSGITGNNAAGFDCEIDTSVSTESGEFKLFFSKLAYPSSAPATTIGHFIETENIGGN